MSIRLALTSVALLLVSACSSVNVNMSLSRLDVPETLGSKNRVAMGLGGGAVSQAQLTSDASARPVVLTDPPSMKLPSEGFGRFRYGLFHFLDVYVRTDVFTSMPWKAGGKFQILGNPMDEAKEGNFSLAVTGAGIFGFQYLSGNQKGLYGPGGFPWNSDLNITGQDYAAIAGYRFRDHAMVYGGAFKSSYYAGGSIHQGASDDGTSGASQYSFQGNGTVQGGNVGICLTTTHADLAFEYSWTTVTWFSPNAATGSITSNPSSFGISGDLRF